MSEVERSFDLDEELDRKFCKTAEELGLSPSDALRIFVKAFVENQGFPPVPKASMKVRSRRVFNADHPAVITPPIRNGRAVLPASWREDDDYDKEPED